MLINQCISNVGCFTLNLLGSGLLIVSAYAFCITKYTSFTFELSFCCIGKARIREGKVRPIRFWSVLWCFKRVKIRSGRRLLHV